jgi:hypothetical protein
MRILAFGGPCAERSAKRGEARRGPLATSAKRPNRNPAWTNVLGDRVAENCNPPVALTHKAEVSNFKAELSGLISAIAEHNDSQIIFGKTLNRIAETNGFALWYVRLCLL